MFKKILFLEDLDYKPLPDPSALKVATQGAEMIFLSDEISAKGVIGFEKNLVAVISNKPSLDLFLRTKESHPNAHKILITDMPMKDYSDAMSGKEEEVLDHVIGMMQESTHWLLSEIRVSLQKIIREDYFGLDKYLLASAKIHERIIDCSSHRAEYTKEIMNYSENLKLGSYISKLLFGIAEEMMMNALHDAPRAAGYFDETSSQENVTVKLKPEHASMLSYGFDGRIFGLSTRDPFGSLEKEKLFFYLKKVLDRDNVSKIIDTKKEGAGLGLFKILYSCHGLVCNVKKNKATEVIALVDVQQQVRDFAKAPRSIHFFGE